MTRSNVVEPYDESRLKEIGPIELRKDEALSFYHGLKIIQRK